MVTAVLPVYLVLGLHLSPAAYGVVDGTYTGATALLRLVGVVTIGDGFVYLLLQRREEFSVGWFPLLAVGTNLSYLLLATPLGVLADKIGRLKVVAGDSYNHGRFSTRAGLIDLESEDMVDSLEFLSVTLDGHRYTAADLNFWGITFAGDDNDQPSWLDPNTIGYAIPRGPGDSDIWTVPADGSGTPRLLTPTPNRRPPSADRRRTAY